MASTSEWNDYLHVNLNQINHDLTSDNADVVRRTLIELMTTANVNVNNLQMIWKTVEYFPEGDQLIPASDDELKKFARVVNVKLNKIDEMIKESLEDYKRVANVHLKSLETYIIRKDVTSIKHFAAKYTETLKKAESMELTTAAVNLMTALKDKAHGLILPKNCFIPSAEPTVDQAYTNLASRNYPEIATILAARQASQTAVIIGNDKIGFVDNEEVKMLPTIAIGWTHDSPVCEVVEHCDSVLLSNVKLPVNLRTGDAKKFKNQFQENDFATLNTSPVPMTVTPALVPSQKLSFVALKMLRWNEKCTYWIDENRAVFYLIVNRSETVKFKDFLESENDVVEEAMNEIDLQRNIKPHNIALRFPLELLLINNIGRFISAQRGEDVKTILLPVQLNDSPTALTTSTDSFIDIMAACVATFTKPASNMTKSAWIRTVGAAINMNIDTHTIIQQREYANDDKLVQNLEWMKNVKILEFNSGMERRPKKIGNGDVEDDYNTFKLLAPSQVTMGFGVFKRQHDFLNNNTIWLHFRKLMISASLYTTVKGYRNMIWGYLKTLDPIEGNVLTFLSSMKNIGGYADNKNLMKESMKLVEPMVKTLHDGTLAKLTEDIANLTVVSKDMEKIKNTDSGKINELLQTTIDQAQVLEADLWAKDTLNEKETSEYLAYIESTRQVITDFMRAEETILKELGQENGDKTQLKSIKRTFKMIRKPLESTSTKCMDNLALMVETPENCDVSKISSNNSSEEDAETTVVSKKILKVHGETSETDKSVAKSISFGKDNIRTFEKGQVIESFTEVESSDPETDGNVNELVKRMEEVLSKKQLDEIDSEDQEACDEIWKRISGENDILNKVKKRIKKRTDQKKSRRQNRAGKDASEPEDPSDSSDSSDDSDDSEEDDWERKSTSEITKRRNPIKNLKRSLKRRRKRKKLTPQVAVLTTTSQSHGS